MGRIKHFYDIFLIYSEIRLNLTNIYIYICYIRINILHYNIARAFKWLLIIVVFYVRGHWLEYATIVINSQRHFPYTMYVLQVSYNLFAKNRIYLNARFSTVSVSIKIKFQFDDLRTDK